jgi:hypothetical protein
LGIGMFISWTSDSHPPMPEVLASLESDGFGGDQWLVLSFMKTR